MSAPTALTPDFLLFDGNENLLITSDVVIYNGRLIRVIVPEFPLASGSVAIEANEDLSNFTDWDADTHAEVQKVIKGITNYWLVEHGIKDHLVYARNGKDRHFYWELVPYTSTDWRLLKQLTVLWSIAFGGRFLTKNEREKTAKDLHNFDRRIDQDVVSIPTFISLLDEPVYDPFSKPDIIAKQRIFEGKEIDILYNYAPIPLGEKKLHFLFVSKINHLSFSQLSESEYVESMILLKKLVEFYEGQSYFTSYFFHKTGKKAGQTIPHAHLHGIIVKSNFEDILGKLTVLKNMIMPPSPLGEVELEARVTALKEELKDVLK